MGAANRGKQHRRWWLTAVTTVVLLLACGTHANAAIIQVTATVDDNTVNDNCTLREAVIAANTDQPVDACSGGEGADVIMVPPGTYVLTLLGVPDDTAATGDLDITADVEIVGDDQANTILDGNRTDRVFDIDPTNTGVNASLSRLTITNGIPINDLDRGGGIRGSVTLDECTVSDNSSAFSGGGISGSTVVVSNSTITGNITIGAGGGIDAAVLMLTGSTVNDNLAERLGIPSSQDISFGGGLRVRSAGQIINSTVTNNSANVGAGLYVTCGTVTLSNSTISDNGGSGIVVPVEGGCFPTVVVARNTIVAKNGMDCGVFALIPPFPLPAFPSVADAYNLSSDDTCGFSGRDLIDTDPRLGPLQDNGGPTFTRALRAGSQAINGGSPDVAPNGRACEVIDQRGEPRPQGTACDIGAFESGDDPTPSPTDCAGDCNNDGEIMVNELVIGVNIALESLPVSACAALDYNGDRAVRIDELVLAIGNSLHDCP